MIVFSLIKSLTKAEKRNFKLYCSPSLDVLYVQLYDVLESIEHYDEAVVLKRFKNLNKLQLNNLNTQLYKQLLKSLAQLQYNSNLNSQLRQVLDFSNILIDKGLITQAFKILCKAKSEAIKYEYYTLALEFIDQLKTIELMYSIKEHSANSLSDQAAQISLKINRISGLANLSIQLSTLNLKLGYARSEKDIDLIVSYFSSKLEKFNNPNMGFSEMMYLYQCYTWYYLIQYDFVNAYKWASRWVNLFNDHPEQKIHHFDHYIRSKSRLLDILFMTRRLSKMKTIIEGLEQEREMFQFNARTYQSFELTLTFSKINVHFLECTFKEGVKLVDHIESFMQNNHGLHQLHYTMMLNYKVACLYFGAGDYENCVVFLQRIIAVKDPKFRRDLQVFARILNLIASYEMGDDDSLERQIKSVYAFVSKINDMQEAQKAIIQFLKRLPYTYAADFKVELITLHNRLKPLESDPFQRRPFFYLDIISWLESKIYSLSIAQVRSNKIVLR